MKMTTTRGLMLATTMISSYASAIAPAVIAGLAFCAAPAIAQDLTTGSLTGIVTDGQGAPVAGANVEAKSNDRGSVANTRTDASGLYRFTNLQPGAYSVSAGNAGFSTEIASDVTVGVGRSVGVDFAIKSNTVAETVVVIGSRRRQVSFSEATTGINVNVDETFDRLPVGRSIAALQLLAPTATVGDTAFGSGSFSSLISLGGASVAENVYYINGMSVTNFRTGEGGSTIPFEFYDQVQIKTGGYEAEYGRATGGAVVAVTKSGSNKFHGGLNYYFEPDSLRSTAPNTFSNLNEKDERIREEGNVWLSGPIWKDRAFFYAFYNARNLSNVDFVADQLVPGGPRQPEVRFQTDSTDPFYGGKIDVNLFAGHRLEYTYLNDSSSELDQDNTATQLGGETQILKYTGRMTDWFTLSVLYGENTFNQTTAGPLDLVPAVFATLNSSGQVVPSLGGAGTVVRGPQSLTVGAGNDARKLLRVDGDFFFDFAGSHHMRIGYDRENLTAVDESRYAGNVYYRYYLSGPNGALQGRVAPNTPYVRVRRLNSGGSFETTNQAIYIQDKWEVNDRLTLNLGLRSETFENFNAAGESFTRLENQIAPRIGLAYDVTGDKSTKITAFFGRYYLPVAGNTNIRLAGNEKFTQDWHLFSAINPTTLIPTLNGAPVLAEVLSDSTGADARTLVSQNLEPQFQDEFIVGYETVTSKGWKFGVNLAYRELKSVLEDFDASYVQSNFCASSARPSSISVANCNAMTIGSGGYVLINPGKDIVVSVDPTGNGTLQTITIPARIADLPQATRKFASAEFRFERPWDGKWQLQGSYVLTRSVGNYEGGVKSDNGQNDTGLTQDFDEPGWMDGSFGYLPNHRAHTLKLFGSYAITEDLIAGFSSRVQSGRKFGCIGVYPFDDGRASISSAAAWYCGGKETPRGSQFEGDWSTNIDLSLAYTVKLGGFGEAQIRGDVFNVLDSSTATDFRELGEDAGGAADPFYKAPTSYQAPRSVRVGLSYSF